jgi:hypothetical protein
MKASLGLTTRFAQNRTPSGKQSKISAVRNARLRMGSARMGKSLDISLSKFSFRNAAKGTRHRQGPLAYDFEQIVRLPQPFDGKACGPVRNHSWASPVVMFVNERKPRQLEDQPPEGGADIARREASLGLAVRCPRLQC